MKKNWKRILCPVLFVAILVGVLLALSPLLRPQRASGDIPESIEGDVDYLVLGDSEGWTAIYPMQLWQNYGYTGYNCSTVGQRLQEDYYLLQDILENHHPKVILMETNMLFGSRGFVGEREDILTTLLGRAIPAFRYHDRWKQLLVGDEASSERDVFRGTHYVTQVAPYVGGDYTQPTDAVKAMPGVQQYFASQIVELCRENDIQLILFSAPSPLCWTYAKHNGLAAFAGQQGVELLDCNLMLEQLGIDWNADTLDAGDHMNFAGATKVTDYVGAYLGELGVLPDHRGETGYESWDVDLSAYLAQTAENG